MRINKKGFKHFIIVGGIILIILFILAYNTLPPRLPNNGKHQDTSSNFVCTGCHNNAREQGSSMTYHFDHYECITCHRPS